MEFTTLLATKKANLSDASKRSYISGWKAIKKMLNIPQEENNIDFLNNVESVIDTIYEES